MFHDLWQFLSAPRHGWALGVFIAGGLIAGGLLLAIIANIPQKFRKSIIAAVTFIAGLFLSIEFLIPKDNRLTDAQPNIANVLMVVSSFTLFLGLGSLFIFHGKNVSKKSKGWGNSLAFFISFFAVIIAGFVKDSGNPVANSVFGVLFGGFMVAMQSTMFSLIAFYIVSAAYRAFRIRSMESALMMLAASIIMLALVPIGIKLTSWIPENSYFAAFRLERLGYWILSSPNMAVQRAIGFGIAVGALAMGLRIWLSLEKGSYYDKQV